jgi:ribosomal protein S18 acetylase RimI-like enzyme
VTVVVRPADVADAGAITDVRFASWRATYGPYLPAHVWDETDREGGTARLAQRLADGTWLAQVAAVDGAIRSYVLYGPSRDDDLTAAGEIYALYAHPDYWSTGLGRALLASAIESLAVRPITLWVLENNHRARRFYEIAGFRTDRACKPADMPGGVQLPEIRYRLD